MQKLFNNVTLDKKKKSCHNERLRREREKILKL